VKPVIFLKCLELRVGLLIAVCSFLVTLAFSQKPFEEIPGCVYIAEDWADGDSFRIKTPDGKELTVRLYGVDCIETIILDKSDVDRLRSQRRYFGIENYNENLEDSIKLAKGFGNDATETSERLLTKPFTIHTSFADARGDARFERVYAFVITSDGKDLSAELVSKGLARAFGVARATLDGRSRDDYQAELTDLELKAARDEKGVWAQTNWEQLPAERSVQRRDDREAEIAKGGGKLKEGETIKINSASRDELMQLPKIAEGRANRIIEGRPFHKLEDLLEVDSIGKTILEAIGPHLDFSVP